MVKLPCLMLPELPHTIDPELLARKGVAIEGKYAISELSRLCEIIQDHSGHTTFRLEFSRDPDNKQSFIRGHIEAQLRTICQRCLGMMELNISTPVYLGVVGTQAAAAGLPDGCEPLILDIKPVSLSALIEDELILALPISAMHEIDRCAATRHLYELYTTDWNNPFRELKNITHRTHKS
ncbi:MAG: YceD family protein [Gammaproteobacteria bacterium]